MELKDIVTKLKELLREEIDACIDAGNDYVQEKHMSERILTELEKDLGGFEVLSMLALMKTETEILEYYNNHELYEKLKNILVEEYL